MIDSITIPAENASFSTLDWEPSSKTYTYAENFKHGDADPEICEHEWWEDTALVYTSNPPCYKQICKLCGKTQFAIHKAMVLPRYKKVVNK